MNTPRMIAIMGPTASGKTHLAERLAKEIDAQLINSDAFQVYRGLDIGTAKPERRDQYRLLDLVDPKEQFGLGQWIDRASDELRQCWEAGRNCILVGGTGLYIRAIFEGYEAMSPAPDPLLRDRLNEVHEQHGLSALVTELLAKDSELASRTDLANPARVKRAIERAISGTKIAPPNVPPFVKAKLGIDVPNETLQTRISERARQMVQNGWSLEIQRLREEGYRPEDPGFRAIGYRTFWRNLEGEIDLSEAMATTIAETRRYAKRQRTWIRSEPRLIPLAVDPEMDPLALAMNALALFPSEE